MKVKICGLTNVEDALCAARAGADFLGLIFYAPSPRCVTAAQAAAIVAAVRDDLGPSAPRCVGVFVDEPATAVRATLDRAGLDLAQLHGDETPELVRDLRPRAFKALRPRDPAEARALAAAFLDAAPAGESLPQILVDAYHPAQFGGTGSPADLAVARTLAAGCRLLLAGGLSPETVGAAVAAVRPWGVDVSSGVERDRGLKDHGRVRAFVQAAREAGGPTP